MSERLEEIIVVVEPWGRRQLGRPRNRWYNSIGVLLWAKSTLLSAGSSGEIFWTHKSWVRNGGLL